MKTKVIPLFLLGFAVFPIQSQVFWTEDFGIGCNKAQKAENYTGINGAWQVVSTGTNGASNNLWFISATENGRQPGECGAGCGENRTLHLGTRAVIFFGF